MDPQGGKESVERLRQAGNGQGRMYLINEAGHHGMFPCDIFVLCSVAYFVLQYILTIQKLLTTCL
jgi:hypothetical protein